MTRNYLNLVLLFILFFCSFCGKKDSNVTSDPPGKPNTVTGKITDATGKPVAGARIRAENPTGNNIHIDATTDSEGKYSMQLTSIGGWKIYAWKEVEFEENVFHVRLGMEKDSDYDAFTTGSNPVTKNFVWKLSGRIPDRTVSKENGSGYFGGTVSFVNYNAHIDQMPAGTVVTINFTPAAGAQYLDGSDAAGKVITKTFTVKEGVGQAYFVNDVPVTKYIIMGTTAYQGVTRKLYLSPRSDDDFYEGYEYIFQPDGGSGNYENGVGSPNENPFFVLHADE